VRRWLTGAGRLQELADWQTRRQRRSAFELLLGRARDRLGALYSQSLPAEEMRAGKAAAFARLRREYEALKASWDGWAGYDRWFEAPLNNARLIPSATYRARLPAFRLLLSQARGDLEAFYATCEALAELSQEARDDEFRRLMAIAEAEVGADGAAN